MDNSLKIFILFLKDNDLYYRYMKNAKRHYQKKSYYQETSFLKYIERSKMHTFYWSETEEGTEFWCDASIAWDYFLTKQVL